MEQIKDGTGKGTLCSVSDDNRLDVSARCHDRIYYYSRKGKAFVVEFLGTMATGGTEEGLGYIKYTGDLKLNLDQIVISTQEPGDALTECSIYLGPTTYSGGASVTPSNMNLTSKKDSDTTCAHNNDGTAMTISGGRHAVHMDFKGSGVQTMNIPGFILGTNNVIAIMMNAATTGTKVRASVLFWLEDR